MHPGRAASDWLVYHKVEERGWPERLQVFRHKNVNRPTGARVRLIAGQRAERRTRYYLCVWFVADKTWREAGKNMASGARGKLLQERPRVDQQQWFVEFRKEKQNFRFGLSPITDNAVVRSLTKIAGLP